VEKLGRGLSNILFGWSEIPVTWDRKMKQGKGLTYLLSTAPVMGAVRAFMRTGIGVYEVFTFPVDTGDRNYEPILEPEYLF
ncbi:MAG: exosortase system-associated protein, TIGR04073 family, partial [Candidatus Hydrogenedentota bacterium]